MRILSVFFITWKLINLLYLLTYLSIYGSWTILTSLMTEVAAMIDHELGIDPATHLGGEAR